MIRAVMATGLLLCVAGCGLANQRHGITWTATLDTLPETACVRDVVGAVPEVSRVDVGNGVNRQVFGIYLKGGGQYPDMRIILIGHSPEPLQFQMVYGDYETDRSTREVAARAIVDGIAVRCGVPELSRTVKEDHNAEWAPYLFNI